MRSYGPPEIEWKDHRRTTDLASAYSVRQRSAWTADRFARSRTKWRAKDRKWVVVARES